MKCVSRAVPQHSDLKFCREMSHPELKSHTDLALYHAPANLEARSGNFSSPAQFLVCALEIWHPQHAASGRFMECAVQSDAWCQAKAQSGVALFPKPRPSQDLDDFPYSFRGSKTLLVRNPGCPSLDQSGHRSSWPHLLSSFSDLHSSHMQRLHKI